MAFALALALALGCIYVIRFEAREELIATLCYWEWQWECEWENREIKLREGGREGGQHSAGLIIRYYLTFACLTLLYSTLFGPQLAAGQLPIQKEG